MKQVKYLGRMIGNGTIQMNPEKVEPIANFPIPAIIKQLRRFLSVCGWYRNFVDNYATVNAPITELLQKQRKFSWTETTNHAFEALKTI